MRRIAAVFLATLAGGLALAPSSAFAQTVRAQITWDTTNDVDLHVYDTAGNHAYYGDEFAIPEAELSPDVIDAGGPETFTDNQEPSSRSFGFLACYFSDDSEPGPTEVAMTHVDPDGTSHNETFTLQAPGDCHAAGDTSLLPDADDDGVTDEDDNCASVPNADQADADQDGVGDVCEPDSDQDGVLDDSDNCVSVANPDQADADGDGIGDACQPAPEPDRDGDGVPDRFDNCVSTANSDQADTDNDGAGDACEPLPPPPPPPPPTGPQPDLGKSVVVSKVSGTVRVKTRTGRFRTLGATDEIPLGSTVDATRGRVRLTSAAGGGAVQTADFYQGQFLVTQTRGSRPITELRLNAAMSCGKGRASTAQRRKKVRRLWGDGRGRFRTRGRHGAATVRGTRWLTQDRCNSTKFTVRRGSITVRDFVKKRNRVVRQGKSFTVKKKKR